MWIGKQYTRREFLKLAGLTAAGGALAGCTPIPITPSSRSSSKVQLVYQDWRTNWFPPMTQQLLEEFHAAHPSIEVFYFPDPENLIEQMPVDMQAGTAADVFQGCCTHFPTWAQQGYTLDLRPFVQADLDHETIADWDPAQYQALFTRDGKQFGLPKYHGALALYYNKDLLDQFHVDYPDSSWTYDDYLQAMRQLTRPSTGEKAGLWGSMTEVSWDRLQVHANAWGGNFVDPSDPTRCRMAEAPALAALEWLRARMWDDRIMATLPDVDRLGTHQAFVSQRIAMVEDGSWALKDILSSATFRIGVAPMPTGPARKVTLATTDGFGIYAGTKHPEAAWELMKFLVSKEYGRAMARANFLQPARASLVEDWINCIRAEYPAQTKELDLAAFAEGQRQGYSVVTEIFANMTEAQKIAQDSWDQILTLGQAPVESMIAAAERIQQAQE
jgi:multiple sugar transport system substrate-binding protein